MIGILKLLFSLFLFLYLFNSIFVDLTKYENVKRIVNETIVEKLKKEVNLEELYRNISVICENATYILDEFKTFTENLSILCKQVQNVSYQMFFNRMIYDIYYKEYNCTILECISRGDFGIIFSKKFNDFLKSMNVYLLIGLIFMVLISIAFPRGLAEVGKSLIYISSTFLVITIIIVLLKLGPITVREIILSKFDNYVYLIIAGICIYIIGKFRSK